MNDPQVLERETVRACIATTTSVDLEGVRREILPWMQYHTELGVMHFYVRQMIRPGALNPISVRRQDSNNLPALRLSWRALQLCLRLRLSNLSCKKNPTKLHVALQVLYDGNDMLAVRALQEIMHVTLIHIHDPFLKGVERQKYSLWVQRNGQWGGQPGNYDLMVKQGGNSSKQCRAFAHTQTIVCRPWMHR